MPVPNTNSFNLQDVTKEIYGSSVVTGNLSQCFTDAVGIFDTNYVTNSYGFKNNLLNFRNYNNTIYDYDGNPYNPIKIGNQIWLTSDFKCKHFSDGLAFTYFDTNTYAVFSDGIYAFNNYGNSAVINAQSYSLLYNGYVISDPRFPMIGWHVPSMAEWNILSDTLGGAYVAGGQLKSTLNWNIPNTGANNASRFSGFPSGITTGSMLNFVGQQGWFWSTDNDGTNRTIVKLTYDSVQLYSGSAATNYGMAVRLIKNTYPTIRTDIVGNTNYLQLTFNGTVQDEGSYIITQRGVCYGNAPDPTISNSRTINSIGGVGSFSNIVTNLPPSTSYFYRAYGINSTGVTYGTLKRVTTNATITVLTGSCVRNSLVIDFYGSGTLNYGSISDKGFCFSTTNSNPTKADSVVSSSDPIANFHASTYQPTPIVTYVRSFITNQYETVYGAVQQIP